MDWYPLRVLGMEWPLVLLIHRIELIWKANLTKFQIDAKKAKYKPYIKLLLCEKSIRLVVERTSDIKTDRLNRIAIRTQTAIMCFFFVANVSKSKENQHRVM